MKCRRFVIAATAISLIAATPSAVVNEADTRANTTVLPSDACRGMPATILGTDGPDPLAGTPGDDVITAGGGRDEINGRQGDDMICARDGADYAYGGSGHDQVWGGRRDDVLFGRKGVDRLVGGHGADDTTGRGGPDDSCSGGPPKRDPEPLAYDAADRATCEHISGAFPVSRIIVVPVDDAHQGRRAERDGELVVGVASR